MSNYTSPSPSAIGNNGQQITFWIPAVNLGTLNATGVQVQISVSPANGLQLITFAPPAGTTYNAGTGLWTIGNLNKGEANRKWLRLVVSVVDIGLAPFTVTSVISGNGIDPNALNNTLVQTIDSVVCNPSAGAVGDPNACNCVDVSSNDTPCTHGATEWRITPLSITNSTTYVFDNTTGKGRFTHVDPTLPISFTYSIWCDTGSGFLETSGPVTVTIPALIEDINIFDHTIDSVNYDTLSVEDIATLTAQHPTTTLADFCWLTLRNAQGVLTSGTPVNCDETLDTKTFFLCATEACVVDLGECSCAAVLPTSIDSQLPVDYVPQNGDTVFIQHPESYTTWVYNGTQWIRSACGCIYKISQDAGNILTLGTDNAPKLTAAAILAAVDEKSKVSANDSTSGFLNGKLVAGTGISFTETNDGANETLVINSTAAPSTNVQVADSCSINMGISGTGTNVDPFIITGSYNDGSPAPIIDSSTPGVTGQVINVSTLWAEPCAAGCTPTYTLIAYPDNVYDNVTLVGTTLTYDILATAPSGTHPFIIERNCTNV